MASKKKKSNVFRLYNEQTGEHYTVRLSREAYDKLSGVKVKRYSKKLNTHAEFKLIKKVK